MEKNEAINRINQFAKETTRKEKEEKIRIKNERKSYEEKLMKLLPRIKEIRDIAQAFADNDIRNEEFMFTDGIRHRVGFYPGKVIIEATDFLRFNACAAPSEFFGMEGGGACGHNFLLNIETGFISYEGEDMDPDYMFKLKYIVDHFDDYEKRVYEEVEKLGH